MKVGRKLNINEALLTVSEVVSFLGQC